MPHAYPAHEHQARSESPFLEHVMPGDAGKALPVAAGHLDPARLARTRTRDPWQPSKSIKNTTTSACCHSDQTGPVAATMSQRQSCAARAFFMH
jgi:hypothetical protein